MLLHGLALATGACPPIGHGPLVEPKRRHDGVQGTPMGEQGHHEDHGLRRRADPVEDGAFGGTEGLTAFFAEKALVLL